jgi:hypothetical protein
MEQEEILGGESLYRDMKRELASGTSFFSTKKTVVIHRKPVFCP